jgi:hypothetical protein
MIHADREMHQDFFMRPSIDKYHQVTWLEIGTLLTISQ